MLDGLLLSSEYCNPVESSCPPLVVMSSVLRQLCGLVSTPRFLAIFSSSCLLFRLGWRKIREILVRGKFFAPPSNWDGLDLGWGKAIYGDWHLTRSYVLSWARGRSFIGLLLSCSVLVIGLGNTFSFLRSLTVNVCSVGSLGCYRGWNGCS